MSQIEIEFSIYDYVLCISNGLVDTFFHKIKIDDGNRCHMAANFSGFVCEDHSKFPTLYWLPKTYMSRFIADSTSRTSSELSTFDVFPHCNQNVLLNSLKQFIRGIVKISFGLLEIHVLSLLAFVSVCLFVPCGHLLGKG